MRLRGKTAIVTGAASGIGRAMGELFAREGARITVADIDALEGERVVATIREQGGHALFTRADVSMDGDVRRMVEETVRAFTTLHVLVNNAGINVMKTAESATFEDWERCMRVDLQGVWLGAKYAIPEIRRCGGGSIINIASMHAFRTMKSCHPYAAAKGGVISMTKSLAVDYGADRIRVNAICPGTIETPLTKAYFDSQSDPEAERRRFLRSYPIGRLGTPEDVAYLALFLASDEASFISGTVIPIDGGRDALSASGG